jgi:hypothetical protein
MPLMAILEYVECATFLYCFCRQTLIAVIIVTSGYSCLAANSCCKNFFGDSYDPELHAFKGKVKLENGGHLLVK